MGEREGGVRGNEEGKWERVLRCIDAPQPGPLDSDLMWGGRVLRSEGDLSGVFCRSLYLHDNPGLTSLPANIFDQNTALRYDALPSFWVGYDQRVTCLVCFAGT
jgi:hypothetical protein